MIRLVVFDLLLRLFSSKKIPQGFAAWWLICGTAVLSCMLPEPTGSTLHLVLLSYVACLSVAFCSLYIRNLMTESPELYLGTSLETAFGYSLAISGDRLQGRRGCFKTSVLRMGLIRSPYSLQIWLFSRCQHAT